MTPQGAQLGASAASLPTTATANASQKSSPFAPPVSRPATRAQSSRLDSTDPTKLDMSKAPLHDKGVHGMNEPKLYSLKYASQRLFDNMIAMREYLNDIVRHARDLPKRSANGCTATTVPDRFINQLLASGSITEIPRSLVKGWVRFFTVPEVFKYRHRPIRETVDINKTWDKSTLIGIKFPNKHDIAGLVNKGTHFAAFDFSAYYDQFEYKNGINEYLCFRKKNRYFTTNRLCMGQRQGCDIAQATTLFLLDFPERRCKTAYAYIDNVIFVGSYDDVLHDSRVFLERCKFAEITVNESQQIEEKGVESCILQEGDWCGLHLNFVDKTVCLINKTITKVEVSWNNRHNWTYRQFAAHVGLLFWSWGIINVPVYNFYALLKFISATSRLLQQNESLWDTPAEIYPSAWPALQEWTDLCLQNKPNRVYEDAVLTWFICTDASAWGWGYKAFNYATGEIRSFGKEWTPEQRRSLPSEDDKMLHSVYAEPEAIYQSLVHLLVKNKNIKYKLINPHDDPIVKSESVAELQMDTDSLSELRENCRQAIAIATDNSSARYTMERRFASRSYNINFAIKRLCEALPDHEFDLRFCFVPGKINPADGPSRGLNDNAKNGTNADNNNLRRLAGIYHENQDNPAFQNLV